MTNPTTKDFEEKLSKIFRKAKNEGKSHIDIVSGDLHRSVGGYPKYSHRMKNCCRVMKKVMKKIDSADAKCVDGMGLSDHGSTWRMDVYIAVDKEIPGAENVVLRGKFLSKVYIFYLPCYEIRY